MLTRFNARTTVILTAIHLPACKTAGGISTAVPVALDLALGGITLTIAERSGPAPVAAYGCMGVLPLKLDLIFSDINR